MPAEDKKFRFGHLGWTIPQAVDALAAHLRSQGYSVNTTRSGFRVLMWRKDAERWSTAHTGQRSRCDLPREWFTLAGPEIDIVRNLRPST